VLPNVCKLLKTDFPSIVASSVLFLFAAFRKLLETIIFLKLEITSDNRDGFVGTKLFWPWQSAVRLHKMGHICTSFPSSVPYNFLECWFHILSSNWLIVFKHNYLFHHKFFQFIAVR